MKNYGPILIDFIMSMIIVLSICNEVYPQSQEVDSLKQVIAGQPDNQGKADNLLKLGRLYYFIDYDSAFKYYERAGILSGKFDYRNGQADVLYAKSLIYRRKADFDSSLSNLEKYIEMVLYLEDSLRLAKGYHQMATLLLDLSDFELALYYSKKSLALFLPLKDTTSIISNYNCLGLIYSGKSEYDSSAYYYLNGISLCERIGDENKLASIFNNLGYDYLSDNQYDNARKYFNMSLEINKKHNNTRSIANNFSNLGGVAGENFEFKEALDYYNQAIALYSQIGDSLSIFDMYNNFGDLLFKQKNYTLALKEFDKALKGHQQIGYIHGIILSLGNKAAVYSELGRIKQAMAMQDSCLTLTYKEGERELRINVLSNISDNYKKTGNYRKAFDYLKQSYALKDSIFNIRKTKVINDLVQKFEKEKDQANILALEKENLQKDLDLRQRTSQRNAYLFSGLVIIVMALFLTFYIRQRAAHDKFIAEQKIRQLQEEKKLMAAKSLVEGQEEERKRIATELHDGLGVLLSATKMQFALISEKNPEDKPLIEKATRMLEQASGDVRKISHNMMPGLLTKLGFFEAAEDLIENIGDTKGLNTICIISGNQDRLAENKEIMLYRIVQEMVNNTLKHAEARNIELQIKVLPGKLDIQYTDDGKGFDFGQKLESESLGLNSIQSRVSFLNGKLAVESKPGEGVKYAFQIPA